MWLSVMRLRRGFLLRSLTGMCFGVCLALATSSAHPLSAQSATAGPSPAQLAEQADQPEAIVDQQSQPGNVVIDGRQVLSVYQSIGSFTPMDRAEKIRERITEVAREGVDP